jgi:hypothetical protein
MTKVRTEGAPSSNWSEVILAPGLQEQFLCELCGERLQISEG